MALAYQTVIDYLRSTGVPHRVTSTLRPGAVTAAGNPSRHGRGLAVDFAGRSWGWDTDELAAIFRAFEPVEHLLHELIYAGPQVSYNIKAGKRVAKYAIAGHHDHVHVAIEPGVKLPVPKALVREEDPLAALSDEQQKALATQVANTHHYVTQVIAPGLLERHDAVLKALADIEVRLGRLAGKVQVQLPPNVADEIDEIRRNVRRAALAAGRPVEQVEGGDPDA